MDQKKHLNAEAALAASKDAEPGSLWSGDYCENVNCGKCYANSPEVLAGCCGVRAVSEVRAALQSGLDAYNKRKAEKAERREEGETITCMQPASADPAVWDAEKGRFTLAERHARMRKWAEAVIKHYPIPDEDSATVWQPGMMDSRLLADEVIAYLADLKSGA